MSLVKSIFMTIIPAISFYAIILCALFLLNYFSISIYWRMSFLPHCKNEIRFCFKNGAYIFSPENPWIFDKTHLKRFHFVLWKLLKINWKLHGFMLNSIVRDPFDKTRNSSVYLKHTSNARQIKRNWGLSALHFSIWEIRLDDLNWLRATW